ncbi:MAG TPA: hypothetical protein VF003_00030 [Pseudonocardiaceae bacterium]
MASPLLALPPQRIAASILTLLRDPAWGITGAHFAHIRRFTPVEGPAARRLQKGRRLWTLSEQLVARAGTQTSP